MLREALDSKCGERAAWEAPLGLWLTPATAVTGFSAGKLLSVAVLVLALWPVRSERRSASARPPSPRDFMDRFARNSHFSQPSTAATDRGGSSVSRPKPDATAPLDRQKFFRLQRADETGRIAPGAMSRALRHRQAMLVQAGSVADAGIDSTRWTWMGPGNIGGRVLSIVIHPVRTDEMLVGSASGGIWKTTDGGANWLPINDFLGSLSVATLAVDPQAPDTVYAGTGELLSSTPLGEPLPEALESCRFWRDLRAQRHWRSRTRRCLVESTGFTAFEHGFRQRDSDPDALNE